jgi:hypothetical protein
MTNENRLKAIQDIESLVEKLGKKETIGLDVEEVGKLEVNEYRSRGYDKAAKVRKTESAHLAKLDFEIADKETIAIILRELIQSINESEHTNQNKIRAILSKLVPYGSWGNLIFTILTKYHVL